MSGRQLAMGLLTVAVTALTIWLAARSGVLARAVDALRAADPLPLLPALLLTVLIQWLRAWRFMLLIEGRPTAPSVAMLRAACLHLALNLFLPLRIGELSFPLLAHRLVGTPLLRGTGALLAARLFDMGSLAAVLALAAVAALDAGTWLPAALVFAFTALGGTWAVAQLGDRVAQYAAHREKLAKIAAPLRAILRSAVHHGLWGRLAAASIAIWLCHGTIAWLAIRAVGLESAWSEGLFAGLAGNAAFALPVSGVAGIGPVQAAFAWALHLTGPVLAAAVAAALACHATLLLGAAVLGVVAAIGPWRAVDRRETEPSA